MIKDLEVSDIIKDLEVESYLLTNERNENAEAALKIKTEVSMDIENEWELSKDKALSNQTKRNAAADEKLAGIGEYVELVESVKGADVAIKLINIDIAFEKRQFTRSTAHIEDIYDIRSSLNLIARDLHTIALDILIKQP